MGDEPPPLDDFEGGSLPVSRPARPVGAAGGGGGPLAPVAGLAVPAGGSTAARSASLPDREFLTDWGSPEEEALQKQMIDAALARNPEAAAAKTAEKKAVTASFGDGWGLKKGFLLGGGGGAGGGGKKPAAAKPAAAAAPADTRPLIKPTAPAGAATGGKSSLVLDEVQTAMHEGVEPLRRTLADQGKWLTPDLLSKVGSNPKLMAGMANPRCMAALDEMQRDPKAAMAKYKDDKEVTEFFSLFMSVMGDHFTKLGEKEGEAHGKHGKHEHGGGGKSGAPAPAHASAHAAPAHAAPAPGSAGVGSTPLVVPPSGTAVKHAGGKVLIEELGDDGAPMPHAAKPTAPDTAGAARSAAVVKSTGGGGGGRASLPPIEEDEDASIRRILADPVLRGILQDPAMQRVMEECRRDGSKLRGYMADPEIRRKLMLMQRAGLIRIEM